MLKFVLSLTRTQKMAILLAADMMLLPLSLLLTFALQPLPTSPVEELGLYTPFLPYLILAAAGFSIWLGLPYIQLKAYEGRAVSLTAVYSIMVAGVSMLLSWVGALGLQIGTHIIFGICVFLLTAATRALLYQVLVTIYRRSTPRCRVLIYGAGTTGMQLASALRTHDTIDPVAFVDDNSLLQGTMFSGLPIFSPAGIARIAQDRKINRVVLAMPSLSKPKQSQIVRHLQSLGLEAQSLPSFAQLIGEEALIDKLAPIDSTDYLERAAYDVALDSVATSYRDRVVLVTGAGGSIGSQLCSKIMAFRPKKLVLYEVSELALYTVHKELQELRGGTDVDLIPVLGSVTESWQTRKVLTDHNVQVIFHAAAYKHVPLIEANPLPALVTNVFGTHTLAREAAEFGVERFILLSSDKAVRPTNVMGASKRLAEFVIQDLATRNAHTAFTLVRFGNVLGSSGSVVPLFQEQVSRGGPVTVTDLRAKRFFMTICEAVQLVLTVGSETRGGEIFVLDMGKPIPIAQLARQVIEANGYQVRDNDNPDGDIEIEIIGLRPGEKLEEEISLTRDLIGTRHRKIFSVQEERLSEIEVAAMLRDLRESMAASDENAARAVLRRWVVGFHRWRTAHVS